MAAVLHGLNAPEPYRTKNKTTKKYISSIFSRYHHFFLCDLRTSQMRSSSSERKWEKLELDLRAKKFPVRVWECVCAPSLFTSANCTSNCCVLCVHPPNWIQLQKWKIERKGEINVSKSFFFFFHLNRFRLEEVRQSIKVVVVVVWSGLW